MGWISTLISQRTFRLWGMAAILTDNFHIRSDEPGVEQVAIVGDKFYDSNVNGDWDSDEPGVGGWRIWKQPPPNGDQTDTTVVGQIGQYAFLVPPDPTTYLITEGTPSGGFYSGFNSASPWINTTATSGSIGVSGQNAEEAGPNFGNVCLGAGGGLTLGFWSNNNGQAIMKSNDNFAGAIAFLNSLNLRNANGSEFNITLTGLNGYKQYRTWLLNANATNMVYMLSAQLSAMELNVRYNRVDGTKPIYAPGTQSANTAGFATVNIVMNEANNALYNSSPTYLMKILDGNPNRPYYQSLKNALDQGNNNLNFVKQVDPRNPVVPCAVPTSWNPLPPTS